MAERITVNSRGDIAALEPRTTRYRAWDAQVPGLCIRVQPSGSRTWFYEYRAPDGAKQSTKVGDANRLGPADARKEARRFGLDPAADKRKAKTQRVARQAEKEAATKRTISAFLDADYLPNHLATTRSGDATADRIRKAWSGILDKDMAELSLLDIERVRRSRREAGLNAQTLNRDWSALRALLNTARRAGLISSVPEVRKIKEDDAKRVRWLGQRDPQERERFLAALATTPEPARTAVTIAYWTGMRRGEVFALEWSDIDFSRGQITVRPESAKTGSARHIPLHPALADHLTKLHRVSALVCPSPKTGGKLTHIKSAWSSLTDKAGLTDFRLHDVRHDFASRLVMKGTDLYVVRDLLGHSTIQLTERYAHLAPERHKQAMEALG